MKEPLACLQGIVGVADTDCDCFADGRPDDYNEAPSGLYLSQLVDLDVLAQAFQCSSSTVWSIGAEALKEASLLFQGNLLQCWATKNTAREKWSGLIGERDCPRPLTPGTTYAGLYINPNDFPEGEMVITKIGTLFTQTGEITVRIYDQLSDTMLCEVDLDTTANTFQDNNLGTPIVLPFTGTDKDSRRYWMLYTVSSNLPKDGEVNCGCSSKNQRMLDWAHMYGTKGNTLSDRRDWNQQAEHMGLLPTATFRCKVEGSICDDTLDFASDAHAAVMAEAIWYGGASKVYDKIRRSSKVTPATSIPHDELKADADKYAAEYAARVASLCNNKKPNSCYVCKPKMRMQTAFA